MRLVYKVSTCLAQTAQISSSSHVSPSTFVTLYLVELVRLFSRDLLIGVTPKLKQGLMSEEESRAWVRGANSDTSLRTYGKDRSIDGPGGGGIGGGGGGFLESRGGGIRFVMRFNFQFATAAETNLSNTKTSKNWKFVGILELLVTTWLAWHSHAST